MNFPNIEATVPNFNKFEKRKKILFYKIPNERNEIDTHRWKIWFITLQTRNHAKLSIPFESFKLIELNVENRSFERKGLNSATFAGRLIESLSPRSG